MYVWGGKLLKRLGNKWFCAGHEFRLFDLMVQSVKGDNGRNRSSMSEKAKNNTFGAKIQLIVKAILKMYGATGRDFFLIFWVVLGKNGNV